MVTQGLRGLDRFAMKQLVEKRLRLCDSIFEFSALILHTADMVSH